MIHLVEKPIISVISGRWSVVREPLVPVMYCDGWL
jgi:hypothetical protein